MQRCRLCEWRLTKSSLLGLRERRRLSEPGLLRLNESVLLRWL